MPEAESPAGPPPGNPADVTGGGASTRSRNHLAADAALLQAAPARLGAWARERAQGILGVSFSRPVVLLLLACAATVSAVIVMIVTPGAPEALAAFDPIGAWTVPGLATATISASWAAGQTLRLSAGVRGGFWGSARRWVAVLGPVLIPIAVLWAQRAITGALWASALWLILLAGVILTPRWAGRNGFSAIAVLLGVVCGLPWLIAVTVGIIDPASIVLVRTWATFVVLGVSVVAVALILTVADVAQSRNAHAVRLLRRQRSGAVVALGVVVVSAIVALRMTSGRELFGPMDAEIWSIREPQTWVHAAAVAAAMVLFCVGSLREPLRPRGKRLVTLILLIAAMAINLVIGGGFLIILASDAISGGLSSLPDAVFAATPYVTVATVLALAVAAIWVARRRTLGLVMVVVCLIWFAPSQVGVIVRLFGGEFPAVSASAGQVCIVVIAAVVVLLVVSTVRDRPVPSSALLRLLVVPIIVLHAAAIVPEVWLAGYARPVFVAATLTALVLSWPHTADPSRGSAPGPSTAALTAMSAAGVLLVAYLFAIGAPAAGEDATATIALLWLAIPLSAVLCCYVREDSEQPVTSV